MPPRRTHKKSRTGCSQCKQRRVKCDEGSPRCGNCVKRDLPCAYISSKRSLSKDVQSPPVCDPRIKVEGGQAPKAHEYESEVLSAAIHSLAAPPQMPDLTKNELPELPISELELMLHFSSDTYRTLRGSERMAVVWRFVAPQFALRNPFLMRGLMAISALHLSQLRPEHHNTYTVLASKHQYEALASFRAACSSTKGPDPIAAYLFSSLLPPYSFAMPKTPGSLGLTDAKHEAASWVSIIRGLRALILQSFAAINSSAFGPLLHVDWYPLLLQPPKPTNNPEVDLRLRDLLYLCSSLSAASSPHPDSRTYHQTLEAQEKSECLKQTTIELQKCFYIVYCLPPDECKISPVMSWSAQFPDEYMGYLSDHDPVALIILAHFAVLMNQLSVWWLDGWPEHLIKTIDGHLTDEWKFWIRWPVSVVLK